MSNAARPNQRLRNWVFTLNNPNVDRLDEWGKSIFNRYKPRFLVYQLERGSNGTPHLQGYIEFKTALRLPSVKKILPRAHLEQRRGTPQQARDYCCKADTRVDGPWEFGEISIQCQGKRTDLVQVAEAINGGASVREISSSHAGSFIKYHRGIREAITIRDAGRAARMADKKVILLYGASHIGKTTWVRTHFGDSLYVKSGAHKWFDGYIDQKVVLIDDFAGGKSGFTCSTMLNIFDRWDCQVEIKGGMVTLRHDVMLVTTNIHPREWYDYLSRDMHYKALANRFSQVVTMVDYKPVVLNKEKFFEEFMGYDNYPIEEDATFLLEDRVVEPDSDLVSESEEESLAPTQEFSQPGDEENPIVLD